MIELNIILMNVAIITIVMIMSILCILLLVRVFDDIECLRHRKQKNELEYLENLKKYKGEQK